MTRQNLLFLTTSALALLFWSVGDAFADDPRLGGSYRGPRDLQSSGKEEAAAEETGGGDEQEGGPSQGDSGSGDGGFSEGSGGGGGGEEGGGGGGGEEGGGSSGSDIGDTGGSSGGSSAGSADTGSGGFSGGGGGGGFGAKGGGSSDTQRVFQILSWYFEHNRERLLTDVLESRSGRVTAPWYSSAALMGMLPRDTRERTPLGTEDRAEVFKLLKEQVLADKAVVRDAAVIALGKLGTPEAVEILKRRVQADPVLQVKQDTLLALGISRDPEALPVLESSVKHRGLRPYALLGLGLTGNAEKAGPTVLDYYTKHIKKSKDLNALSCAAMALGALQYEDAVVPLSDTLKRKKAKAIVKVYAAHALGKIGTEDAQKALTKAVDDKNQDVSRAALLALGNFPNKDALKVLVSKGLKKSDEMAMSFACVSIGRVLSELPEDDWKSTPSALREIAMKPARRPVASQYAALALTMFPEGNDEDVEAFYQETFTKRKLDKYFLSALSMTAGIGGMGSVEPMLQEIATDVGSDPDLSGYAALALGMLGQPDETSNQLRKIYNDDDREDVRRSSLIGLGIVGDRRDVRFLTNVIKRDDTRPGVEYTRGAAVTALGMIRDGESVAKIRELLKETDPRTRAYAVAALGCLVDKDPTPAMARMFEHNNFRSEFATLKIVMSHL